MLTIIIIDDEEETRQGLAESINWDELDIEVIGTAEDGKAGLELAITLQPDIVLLDVRMPLMNGIECAGEIRKHLKDCKIIFLSGYSDKEYLKSAIQLSAIDYVEKPIQLDEVVSAIEKAALLCKEEKEKKDKEAEVNSSLMANSSFIKQELALELIHRNINISKVKQKLDNIQFKIPFNDFFISILIKLNFHKLNEFSETPLININSIKEIIDNTLKSCSGKYIFGVMENEYIIIQMFGKQVYDTALLKDVLTEGRDRINNFFQCDHFVTMGVGEIVRGIENVPKSYHAARKALQKYFVLGYDSIVFYQESKPLPSDFGGELNQLLQEYFKNEDLEEAVNLVQSFVSEIKRTQSDDIAYIKGVFLSIMAQIINTMKEKEIYMAGPGKGQDLLWTEMLSLYTLDEVRDFILEKILYMFREMSEKKGKSRKVCMILDYLRLHYFEDIEIKDVADYVELAPTYICQLFKKETGKTINAYLEEIRIEKAKDYLRNGKMKLNEVANLVGYNKANYFASIFKKVTGLYPSEYKRRII